MRRKAAIHYKPTDRGLNLAKLAGDPHFHFCRDRDCRLIYEDTCYTPAVNELCQRCRGAKRELMRHRDPHECCIDNCVQLLTRAEIMRYSLAGPGPWYQCAACKRCHGWSCAT